MESNGKYWIPIYNILEEDCSICLAHPKYVKAIKGKKTDKKMLNGLLIYLSMTSSTVALYHHYPRELRDLVRYHFKLTNFSSSESNRFQNSLTVSNITLSSVLSDILDVSGSRIIEAILENPSDEINLPSLINGSLKRRLKKIELAINGKITNE